jgi:hypothetical protein
MLSDSDMTKISTTQNISDVFLDIYVVFLVWK